MGFTQPVSLHWSPNLKYVYVAEKLGYIYKFNGFNAAKGDGQLVLDIAQKVRAPRVRVVLARQWLRTSRTTGLLAPHCCLLGAPLCRSFRTVTTV